MDALLFLNKPVYGFALCQSVERKIKCKKRTNLMNGKMNAIEILKKNEDVIKKKYGVRKIGVFGSFARGEEKEGSDVDVLVELEDNFENFDNYIELKYFLEDLFGRKVDLVTVEALRPQLKDDILKEVSYA